MALMSLVNYFSFTERVFVVMNYVQLLYRYFVTTSQVMNRLLLIIFLSMSLMVSAEELRPANRWDIALKPYKLELQGELVRAIDDYRSAVNQTGIQPSRDRQIRAEIDRLTQLLKSRGYYLAVVESAYDDKKNKPKYQISLGVQYEISELTIVGNYQPADDDWRSIDIGQPLSAVLVLAQQAKLKKYIESNGCYFNVSVNHEVKLDEGKKTASVAFLTDVSDPTKFAPVDFTGIGGIQFEFLKRVTDIRSGQCYSRVAVDNAVIGLFDTGLFRQVRPSLTRAEDGSVIVSFNVEKRKKRTFNASLGWQSEQGFGTTAGWLHRDLFGSAQSLSLQGALQSTEQSASAKIVIPSFYDRRNRLSWLNEVVHKSVDIESYTYSSTASLERKASRQDYYEYGIGYRQIDDKEDTIWKSYQQIRLPLQYRYDSVLDPFNPQRGIRARFQVEPVFDINEGFTPFIKTGVGLQNFFTVDNELTLATRLRWSAIWYGDILGSSSSIIPASELYTAGGSTSIRGYAYESIGLAEAEDVAGGTQRWLAVNEIRLRLNESWGLVGFWDAGSIGSDMTDFNTGDWYQGIGAGVRYFTRFAPVRLDVAVPLNKREDDAGFLIYVSLGQAF